MPWNKLFHAMEQSVPPHGTNGNVLPSWGEGMGFVMVVAIIQKKKPLQEKSLRQGLIMKGGVVPPGIEPGTHGFSVRCSTN